MDALETTPGTSCSVVLTFKDENKALADPTTVSVRIRKPDDTLVIVSGISVVRISLGLFKVSWTFDESGWYWFTGVGTGVVAVTSEDIPVYCNTSRTIAP